MKPMRKHRLFLYTMYFQYACNPGTLCSPRIPRNVHFFFSSEAHIPGVSCQQECQNCSPRMTKLCILKFLLKKIQLSSFFLYLNIPKNTFKHFLKMILNFDNLLNLFVPFIWHFTQCHFSSFNPIYIPLYHIFYASLSLIFIFSDSDDVRSASS